MNGSALEADEEVVALRLHGGPVWLRIRGSPRVKAFIAETVTSRVELKSVAEGVQP